MPEDSKAVAWKTIRSWLPEDKKDNMWHGRGKCCDSWPVQYVKLTGEEAGAITGEGVEGVDYTPFWKKGGQEFLLSPPPFLQTNLQIYCTTCFPSDTKLIVWSNQPILYSLEKKGFMNFKICKYCFCCVCMCHFVILDKS